MKTHASGAMWESLIPHSVCYLMIMCLTTTQCNLSDMCLFFFLLNMYIYILYLCTVYISALCYGYLCIWWWLLRGNRITSHWTEMLLLLACFFFVLCHSISTRPPPFKTHTDTQTHTPATGYCYIWHCVSCSSTQPSDGEIFIFHVRWQSDFGLNRKFHWCGF